ncbi:MAG: hypothetical protein U0792_20890 [Gemmataceae bacterium]
MSMIPCPGCGMPRVEDQRTQPCPVCAAVPSTAAAPAPVVKQPSGPDPTVGLPTDVASLNRVGATGGGFPTWFPWAAVFLLGIATGVGGLLAWQATQPPREKPEETASVTRPDPRPLPPVPTPISKKTDTAPVPHEPKPAPEPEEPVLPLPEPKHVEPQPDRQVVVELNQPNGIYTIPFSMKKGERVVLKGRVGTLRVHGLDSGAVLDAAGLEAGQVYIGGKIDNGSTLKVNSPGGKVTFAAAVVGKSKVEINAPSGDVIFSVSTTPTRPGSAIDGGSTVAITARTADLKGDINGSNTKITVSLPRTGTLKIVAIRGTATVEYRVGDGKGTPEISAAFVSPAASFKKID